MVSTRKSATPGSVMLSLPMSTPSSAKSARPVKASAGLKRAREKTSDLRPKLKIKPRKKKPWECSEDELGFGDSEDDEAEEEDTEVVEAKKESMVEVEKKPIFTTFSTDDKLDEGICIIRNLGGGKYEIVNLKNVHRVEMGAEATGEIVKSISGRLEMLDIKEKDWEEANVKALMAVKSAQGEIFRLEKLPLELRYKIFGYVLLAPAGKSLFQVRGTDYHGHGLLLSCRQFWEESRQFVYKNSFRLNGLELCRLAKSDWLLKDNLRNLDFWWGSYTKDSRTFKWMATLSGLKVLKLSYGTGAATNWGIPNHRNILYQDYEEETYGLCHSKGFDQLVSLRGLEKVIVARCYSHTEEEKNAVERFLNGILTLPKDQGDREDSEESRPASPAPPRLTARQLKLAENAAKKSRNLLPKISRHAEQ